MIKTITTLILLFSFTGIAMADTSATVSLDWLGTCKSYFNQAVTIDPVSIACDLDNSGAVNGSDFALAYGNGANGQILVPATSTPVTTLPAIDTFVDPSNVGIPSGGGGLLLPGSVNCSPFATICLRIAGNGSWVYWNQ